MKNKISVYELLGLIKDGKAPKKIKYKDNNYIFTGYDYHCILTNIEKGFVEYRLIKNYIQDLQSILNEKVEILEEDKSIIEKINGGIITSRAVYTNFNDVFKDMSKSYETIDDIIIKLNEVIDYINRKEDK